MAKQVDFSGASTLRRMDIRIVLMDQDLLLAKVLFILIFNVVCFIKKRLQQPSRE